MIELGKYIYAILIAYSVGLLLIGLLIWQSVSSNRRARYALETQEAAAKGKHNAD